MGIESILGAVAGPLIGGIMGSDASSSAADAQVQSADKATQLQRDIYNSQVQLNNPYRQMGLGAGNRLMTLLGIQGGAPATGVGGSGTLDRNTLRAQLLPKYTTQASGGPVADYGGGSGYTGPGSAPVAAGGQGSTIDEAGLNAEIDRQMAQQPQQQQVGGDTTDPAYGSLMQDAPGMHNFTMADYQADPGYQFRLDQGNKGLERTAAARGGLMSGRAAKDAMAWNSGQASQEYQNAFNRFNTDQTNAFNRFQTNRSNKLNPLQSLLGVGQTGTAQISNAAQNYGNNASQNIMGAGNAQASGIMGGANAISGAIGQGYNNYNQNQLMNKIWGPTGSGNYGGGNYPNYNTGGNGTYNGMDY